MKTLFSRLITVIACFFIFSAAWFCLWSISLHLVERPDMAVLLFPFGLRLGLMLQCPRGYWPVLLGAEWLLIYWLTQAVGLTHFPLLMIGSLLTLLPVALISRYRHQRDWRTLLLQGAALTAAALLQSLPWLWHGKESWNALLLTLTGGLTLAPICLVFWHYLANNTWLPLGPSLVSQPINWRGRHLVWYLLLFVISLWLQLGLPDELSRFTPFCLALPIIALAWHYGWQGALIATLMNAIALIASQTWRDHPVDLLLSLLVQSLTGLLLGAGIQRLRELNQSLQKELARNQHLAERLLETEESVRRDVARELHDDIGQTITTIREDVFNSVIDEYIEPNSLAETWKLEELEKRLASEFLVDCPVKKWVDEDSHVVESVIRERVVARAQELYDKKCAEIGKENQSRIEKGIMLQCMDMLWKEHLAAMDYMRQGIGLQGYAQRNPKNEYKIQSFNLFTKMLDNLKYQVIRALSRVQFQIRPQLTPEQQQELARILKEREAARLAALELAASGQHSVGRNDPCPCGSGKKYKDCCGKLKHEATPAEAEETAEAAKAMSPDSQSEEQAPEAAAKEESKA